MQDFEQYGRLLFYMVLGVCMHAPFFTLWLFGDVWGVLVVWWLWQTMIFLFARMKR
jgi:hypothetical protein